MATARMTRAEARRIEADKEIMRYAARNLRMCQMRAMGTSNVSIAGEVGLSPSRTSRIISKGEDHWQMWLDRAIEEGIEQENFLGAVPEPDGERVEMIDVTTIGDNPWQPRKTVFEDDVTDMLQDVAENGLHHAIVLRSNGASLELVLGQVRLAAFRMGAESEAAGAPVQGEAWSEYHDRATGITRIPAVVREMTDNEVIAASLSENLNRNSMVWSDETRALALAAEQPGITARQVAASAKMSPAQLSNRIRLLRLPDKILQLIDKDVLSWTAARELLAFAPPDHIHSDELEYCEKRLWTKHREYVGQGRETQRITAKQVLTVMANALNVEPDQWACVGAEIGQRGIWIRGNHFKPAPKFDVDAFKGKHGDWVHTLPYLWGTDPLKTEMTCVGWIWSAWQERAEKAEEEQAKLQEAEKKAQNQPGPRATAFSNENPRAKYLPRPILEMLDSGKLSETFVHRLMNGFVKNESHHHREHLEDIARRLQHLSGFKSPDTMSDAAAGGAVLATVRKVLGSEFRSLDERLTSFGFESPRFAMDKFIEEQQAMIHNVPLGIGIVRLTCNTAPGILTR